MENFEFTHSFPIQFLSHVFYIFTITYFFINKGLISIPHPSTPLTAKKHEGIL